MVEREGVGIVCGGAYIESGSRAAGKDDDDNRDRGEREQRERAEKQPGGTTRTGDSWQGRLYGATRIEGDSRVRDKY